MRGCRGGVSPCAGMSRQPRRSTTKQQKRKRKARVSARMPASAGNGRFAHRQGNDLIRPHCARPPSSGGKAPRPAAVRLRWKRQVEPLPWNRASKSSPKQTASAGITSSGCCILYTVPEPRETTPTFHGRRSMRNLRRPSQEVAASCPYVGGRKHGRSGATAGEPRPSATNPAPFPSGEGVAAKAVTDRESLACSASRLARCEA